MTTLSLTRSSLGRRAIALPRWREASRRRQLQVVLGLVWLVDAALQFQPYMFGTSFVTSTLEPAANGAPSFVSSPSFWADHFMIHHIAVYNVFFASIQLAIALGILFGPTVEIALAISIVWSVAVWWLGEGLGGVTTGNTAVMGAPGAVILYAFLALLVWPTARGGGSVAERALLGRVAPKIAWAVMWASFAYLQLEAVNRSPSALYQMVFGMADGEPGWIKSIDSALAAPLAHHGTEWSLGLAIVFVVVGLAVFVAPLRRPALVVAIVMAVLIWAAEDFGQIATGKATDVNSGPLLALIALSFWPGRTVRSQPASC